MSRSRLLQLRREHSLAPLVRHPAAARWPGGTAARRRAARRGTRRRCWPAAAAALRHHRAPHAPPPRPASRRSAAAARTPPPSARWPRWRWCGAPPATLGTASCLRRTLPASEWAQQRIRALPSAAARCAAARAARAAPGWGSPPAAASWAQLGAASRPALPRRCACVRAWGRSASAPHGRLRRYGTPPPRGLLQPARAATAAAPPQRWPARAGASGKRNRLESPGETVARCPPDSVCGARAHVQERCRVVSSCRRQQQRAPQREVQWFIPRWQLALVRQRDRANSRGLRASVLHHAPATRGV